MYYLDRIIILTEDEKKSELKLEPGLNIIYGPSNTGKSLVAEIVDFMFGGDGEKLSDNKIRFKQIKIIVVVDGKTLTMSREIGSNEVLVSGAVPGIDDGIYKVGNAKKSLNKLWLHLMGIDDDVQIIAKMDYSSQRLTVRTFIHSFLIKESRMMSENSVLKKEDGYNRNIPVPTITSLLYFATEETFLEGQSVSDKKIQEAKNEAVKKFVDRSLQKLSDVRISDVDSDVPEAAPEEIQEKIDVILDDIAATERVIDDAVKKSRKLASLIFEIDEQLAEAKMLKNRYRSLRSQYEADVKRLTFIAEGDIHKEGIQTLVRCPFCDGELEKEKEKSCVEAAIAEVESIQLQIEDLRAADMQIDVEIEAFEKSKETTVQERKNIQKQISAELEPKVSDLRKMLINYTAALGKAKTNELLDKVETTLNVELKDVVIPVTDSEKFDVREKIKDIMSTSLDESLLRILRATNYEGISSASFDIDKCDVKVNGVGKQSQGQGFRAFLNAVMAIAVQEFLKDAKLHQPGLMVLDSPILSLNERRKKVEGPASDTMKAGLFQYLVDHSIDRQTIIIENEIPKGVDFTKAKLIPFTKEDDGRYGLVKDYKD